VNSQRTTSAPRLALFEYMPAGGPRKGRREFRPVPLLTVDGDGRPRAHGRDPATVRRLTAPHIHPAAFWQVDGMFGEAFLRDGADQQRIPELPLQRVMPDFRIVWIVEEQSRINGRSVSMATFACPAMYGKSLSRNSTRARNSRITSLSPDWSAVFHGVRSRKGIW
jgi:hypothetical protein